MLNFPNTKKSIFPNSYFVNNKKTFLAKLDKSKKGYLDKKVIPLLKIINSKPNYYTTSSCSGRIYLWSGTAKKNEMKWLKVSHELIDESFFEIKSKSKNSQNSLLWLRLEDFILHVCCRDFKSANELLAAARKIYKKSCILSFSNKLVVEIRGSEFIEMPLYLDGKLLFDGELNWLADLINNRLNTVWEKTNKFERLIK